MASSSPYDSYICTLAIAEKTFGIHRDILFQLCEDKESHIGRLLDGGSLKWGLVYIYPEEVPNGYDAATVERLIQFAYASYYNVPEPKIDDTQGGQGTQIRAMDVSNAEPKGHDSGYCANQSKSPPPASCSSASSDTNTTPSSATRIVTPTSSVTTSYRLKVKSPKSALPKSNKQTLKEAFNAKARSSLGKNYASRPPGPRVNTHPNEDFTQIFLAHAQVYIFATVKCIYKLEIYALSQLRAALASFKLYEERVGDVVTLLRYVYGHDGDQAASADTIKDCMQEYIGCELEVLIKDADFKRWCKRMRSCIRIFWNRLGRGLSCRLHLDKSITCMYSRNDAKDGIAGGNRLR
ncbi:uncharacterized protein KY384_003479 [Bacidia gigantensis]|uniref:uncharacterized protein n=1 Tax=Bacidia gigantensis TaxID=2732470 RepID=UPI001D038AE3|nr:uncharacterized protein KY384_003479 [Bacidia gigantensis]KAG8531843.1 hypothetical protein KY384_003479 [Bacidia gigantensis]